MNFHVQPSPLMLQPRGLHEVLHERVIPSHPGLYLLHSPGHHGHPLCPILCHNHIVLNPHSSSPAKLVYLLSNQKPNISFVIEAMILKKVCVVVLADFLIAESLVYEHINKVAARLNGEDHIWL